MNKEQIIALAEEKGACTHREHWELYPHIISFGSDELFAFANAIEERQRNKDASLVELAASDEDSDIGDLCTESFNNGAHVTALCRLQAWSATLADAIRSQGDSNV